jgi:proton-dependent oligopeptide transporter, POT family
MKGVFMAFWYLSITVCNLSALFVNATVRNEAAISRVADAGLTENAFLMFFFAKFALLVTRAFGRYARGYPMQDHYRIAGH